MFLPLLFLLFSAFISNERLITIIHFNGSSCCNISFMRVSRKVLKLSCSCFLLCQHFLVIHCSWLVSNNDYTFIGDGGGGFTRVVIRVVLYYTSIFCQNTQIAGHVRVLLVCSLTFLIDVCRMRCLCFIL